MNYIKISSRITEGKKNDPVGKEICLQVLLVPLNDGAIGSCQAQRWE